MSEGKSEDQEALLPTFFLSILRSQLKFYGWCLRLKAVSFEIVDDAIVQVCACGSPVITMFVSGRSGR
jgi:hypothetical protein